MCLVDYDYGFFTWLGIEMDVFKILLLLMSIDSVVGAIKAVRLGGKFKFRFLTMGIVLKLCFLVIPLVIALLGKGIGSDFSLGVDFVMKILIVSEGYSILGNIYSAKNKVKIESLDVISMLLNSLRKRLKTLLNKLLSSVTEETDCNLEEYNKKDDLN